MSTTKLCPRCSAPLDATAYAGGQPFSCTQCGAKVQRKSNSTENVNELNVNPIEDDNRDSGILDELQNLLTRMILGIFQFILVKLPTEICRALVRWFPTLMRLIKVCALIVVLLAILTGPMCIMLSHRRDLLRSYPYAARAADFYASHEGPCDSAVWIWTVLALCGAIWGALRLKRRKKRLKEIKSSAEAR